MWKQMLVGLTLIAAACTGAGASDELAPSPETSAPAATAPLTSAVDETAPPQTTTTTVAPTTTTTTTTAPPPTTTAPPPLDRSDDATLDRLADDLAVALELGPHPAGSEAEVKWGEYIEAQLTGLGLSVESEEVPLPTGAISRNLWVTVGSASEHHVLLGAHYDSVEVSPGIDDNGSGVAVLVELARRYVETPPSATVMLVFFGAEEVPTGYGSDAHHYGSRLMAARMADADELPDLMVSVDMIGVGATLYGVTYLDRSDSAARLLAASGESAGVAVALASRGDISDHEAFARAGTPSVFMWRPDNPAWHTASDDHYEPEALLEDIAVLEAFVELAPQWLSDQ